MSTKFLSGALAGMAAGVLVGMLVAPDTGDNTRKRIRYTAGNWRHKVGRLVGKGTTDLAELKRIIEHEVTGLKDDVRERILRIIEESKSSYDNFKKEALSDS